MLQTKDKEGMRYLLGNEFIFLPYSKIINIVVCYIIVASYMQISGQGIILGENEEEVPALIVFGDSIVDSGNNNYIATIGKVNFPPYGRDFPGGISTGRYSNGKIPSDFFAQHLGIKELVPPYLDPNLQISDLLTGVSFASGVAGYDPTSAKLANVLSLEDQVRLFKEYKKKVNAAVGENKTSAIISKSIYLLSAGSNDITNIYFSLPFTRLQFDISTYTDFMVAWASSFLQELYALGARKIGVINTPPCGCLPSQRTLYGGLFRDCAREENQASILFNDKLYSMLNSLNLMLPQSRILYLDIYNPLLDLINNPSQSGFEVVNKGCCGTGELEVSLLCKNSELDPFTCKNASKYVFWDSFHPTEATYRFIVNAIYQKSIDNFFS